MGCCNWIRLVILMFNILYVVNDIIGSPNFQVLSQLVLTYGQQKKSNPSSDSLNSSSSSNSDSDKTSLLAIIAIILSSIAIVVVIILSCMILSIK